MSKLKGVTNFTDKGTVAEKVPFSTEETSRQWSRSRLPCVELADGQGLTRIDGKGTMGRGLVQLCGHVQEVSQSKYLGRKIWETEQRGKRATRRDMFNAGV